jgi:hypothetical protein
MTRLRFSKSALRKEAIVLKHPGTRCIFGRASATARLLGADETAWRSFHRNEKNDYCTVRVSVVL